jgi:hypothetical protein
MAPKSQASCESRAAQDDDRQDIPHPEAVTKKSPRDLEQAVADHKRGHHRAKMLVG